MERPGLDAMHVMVRHEQRPRDGTPSSTPGITTRVLPEY